MCEFMYEVKIFHAILCSNCKANVMIEWLTALLQSQEVRDCIPA
jgi:hypothetical protein